MTIWWQIKATKEFLVKFHEMFGLALDTDIINITGFSSPQKIYLFRSNQLYYFFDLCLKLRGL